MLDLIKQITLEHGLIGLILIWMALKDLIPLIIKYRASGKEEPLKERRKSPSTDQCQEEMEKVNKQITHVHERIDGVHEYLLNGFSADVSAHVVATMQNVLPPAVKGLYEDLERLINKGP